MKHLFFPKILKIIVIGTAVCGLLLYLWVFPVIGQSLTEQYPEFAYSYYPWLILLWVTAVPCYIVLVICWKIAVSIGRSQAFTMKNAGYFSLIARLAVIDTVIFLAGNIVYLILGMNHPGIVIASLFITFIGIAFTVCMKVLSDMVEKAAELQTQSDLTI